MLQVKWLLLGVTMLTSLAGCYASVEPEHPRRHYVHHDVVVRERVVYDHRDHRHYR